MNNELFWLTLTLAMAALAPFPYVLNRMARRGLLGTMANPRSDDPPLADWAQRAQRAHANAAENLVVFAPAAIAVHVLAKGNDLSVFACQLYFFSRLIHYVVFAAGVPVLRTLAYFGGWAGCALLIAQLLGLA